MSTPSTTTAPGSGYAAVLAGLVSFAVAEFMFLLVDQLELLLAFTAEGAALMLGAREAYYAWARRDKRIDLQETFHLDFFTLMQLILFFCASQIAIRIVKNLLLLGVLKWMNAVLILGLVVFLVLAFLPSLSKSILYLPTTRLRRGA